ncbi:MAG: DUF3817 domain-containing protein [Leucobacter sp.]
MQLQPKPEDYPRIRRALSIYKVTSVITGFMLLVLCAVMVMRYAFGVELFLFTPNGVAEFLPTIPKGQESEFVREGFDLFQAILIAHGWFYVVYLISDFMLWSPMRWGFGRFLYIALGGVIPFLSFYLEGKVARDVTTFLAEKEAALSASEPVTLDRTEGQA